MSKILLTGSRKSGKTTFIKTIVGEKVTSSSSVFEITYLNHSNHEYCIHENSIFLTTLPYAYKSLIFFFSSADLSDQSKLLKLKDYLFYILMGLSDDVPVLLVYTDAGGDDKETSELLSKDCEGLIGYKMIKNENKCLVKLGDPKRVSRKVYKKQALYGIKWVLKNMKRKNVGMEKINEVAENTLNFFGELMIKTNDKMNKSFTQLFEMGSKGTNELMEFFKSNTKLPIILICGIRNSGKTSLFNYLLKREFDLDIKSSSHPSFNIVKDYNGTGHSFKLFDVTSTKEKDLVLNLNPNAIIYIFDGSEEDENLTKMIREKLYQYLEEKSSSNIPFLIIKNKKDLFKESGGEKIIIDDVSKLKDNRMIKLSIKEMTEDEKELLFLQMENLINIINKDGVITKPKTIFNNVVEEFQTEVKGITKEAKELGKKLGEEAKKIGTKGKEYGIKIGEEAKKQYDKLGGIVEKETKELTQKTKENVEWLVKETKNTYGWISDSISNWWSEEDPTTVAKKPQDEKEINKPTDDKKD